MQAQTRGALRRALSLQQPHASLPSKSRLDLGATTAPPSVRCKAAASSRGTIGVRLSAVGRL